MRIFFTLLLYLNVNSAWAQESISHVASTVADKSPIVGSHVSTNMNAASMLLSLLIVLAVIVLSAFLLKRFNLVQTGNSQLKIITSLSLGNKEKIVVVQVGEKQLLLGITAQQINVLESLDEPLVLPKNALSPSSTSLERSLFSLLKKT